MRVSGSTKKIRDFLAESSLVPLSTYFRGDPGFPKSRGPIKTSGFNVSLSDSHATSLARQSREAIQFIKKNHDEFTRLASYGFKTLCLDFGLNDLATEEHPWPTYRIPKELISIAGEFGLDIVLSFYGPP